MNATKAARSERKANLSQQDALNLLASALAYCQRAGWYIEAGNTASGLTIVLRGARLGHTETGEATLEIGEMPTNAPLSKACNVDYRQ